jgi:hypothetical protein
MYSDICRTQVTVRVNSTSDGESIRLRESGIDSSVFTGRLTTATGTAVRSNNVFTVATERDVVAISYSDACPPATRTPAVAPRSAIAGVLTVPNTMINPGASMTITVTDGVLNTNATVAETYTQVCLASMHGGGASIRMISCPYRRKAMTR